MAADATANPGLRRLIGQGQASLARQRAAAVSRDWLLAFRWLVLGCQAATVLITWPLWQVRTSPPMLPALSLPAVDLGLALLAALALAVVFPLPGILLQTVLLVYAVALDQTRLQPEVVSLSFLLWGTLPSPTAKTFARAHLVSLWFFAGLNKLLSPDFLHQTAQWILAAFVAHPPPWLRDHVGYLIASTEMTIGVLAFLPRTRKLAGLAALGLHTGILLDLLPTGHDWNRSVWPWNVALAFAGLALIAPWQESPVEALRICRPLARPLLVLFVLMPLGFYVGVTDAYLAHNLYSSNTATAEVRCPVRCRPQQLPNFTWSALDVPMPPERRLYEEYFRRTCRPGDQLLVKDSRWWYRRRGLAEQRFTCPAKAPQG